MVEPDTPVYQENFARSKRFIVLLLIGAIWGWLTGPAIVPSPLNHVAYAAFNRTSATSHPPVQPNKTSH